MTDDPKLTVTIEAEDKLTPVVNDIIERLKRLQDLRALNIENYRFSRYRWERVTMFIILFGAMLWDGILESDTYQMFIVLVTGLVYFIYLVLDVKNE